MDCFKAEAYTARGDLKTRGLGALGLCVRGFSVLKGSWDLVTGVIIRVTMLITPIKVLITLLTKSHDPPSRVWYLGLRSSAAAGLEFRDFRAINVKGLRTLASSKLRVRELGLGG